MQERLRKKGRMSMRARPLVVMLALHAVVLLAGGGVAVSGAAAETGWAPKLTAVYKLRMAGMELGTFNFNSTVKGEDYALAGHGKLGWGFGMYTYNGSFSSAGKIERDQVRPSSYAYDWKVNRKAGLVRLGFVGGSPKSIEIVPPQEPSPEVVPVLPEHLKAVFDPLSALLALSRLRAGDPCDRKIAVYEGKQRFDLVLAAYRLERIVEAKPSGQPVGAHVCRAKYVPVSGHKFNKETQAMVKADGIEVALRPVPSANLLVPYRITIPTPLGTAVLTAQRVEITAQGDKLIALVH